MEGDGIAYVGGDGTYRGNVLLDPDGTVTRAELYEAVAEASTPVTVELAAPDWCLGLALTFCALQAATVAVLARIAGRLRRHG